MSRADSGAVQFNGTAISGYGPDKIAGLGIGRTFQLTRIFPRLTVTENMHVAITARACTALRRWTASGESARACSCSSSSGSPI